MKERERKILFRLTETALLVANTGRHFSLHGLYAVVYGWTSTKGEMDDRPPEPDRPFHNESDAQSVLREIRENKRESLRNYWERRSQSNQQNQTVQSYAGRTLFELLQNAVDANSDKPIGYKGVGFRSVLNITESPEIYSGCLHAKWAPEVARKAVGELSTNPPVLSFPAWSEDRPEELDEFDTVIRLPLAPEKKKEIENEWTRLVSDPSMIVFIPGVEEITWDRGGVVSSWKRNESPGVLTVKRDTTGGVGAIFRWTIAESGTARVAIPVDENWKFTELPESASTSLRNFFPTEEPNPFQNILIHAEFPLHPNRKHVDTEHADYPKAIEEVSEAVTKIASRRESIAEFLDILCLKDTDLREEESLPGKLANRTKDRIKSAPLLSLGNQKLSSRRTCPRRFPENIPERKRIELWESFKACLVSKRQDGLDGLPLLPCEIETSAREETLLWLDPNMPLSLEELRQLAWAKCENQSWPFNSRSLFAPPEGETDIPDIPAEIDLRFLDRELHNEIESQLEYRARTFLSDVLGVEAYDLESVVTGSIIPALEENACAETVLQFVFDLWLRSKREKDRKFDGSKDWKVQLSRVCRVRCEDDSWHPAIEVYAGEQWTGSDYLERAYRGRPSRWILHSPCGTGMDVENWALFYQWLGVGWCPKAVPIVIEDEKRAGWEWIDDKFRVAGDEPDQWHSYCQSAWAEKYRLEDFTERNPRLKCDWTVDGSFTVFNLPGAYENLQASWSYLHLYSKSECGWSSNMKVDYDNKVRDTISYLFWRLQRINWIASSSVGSARQPIDCFQRGEVSSARSLKPFVSNLPENFSEEMVKDLEIRKDFDEISLEDWQRWLERTSGLTPNHDFEHREIIRRLYNCILQHESSFRGEPPFASIGLWWVERLEDRENWTFAPAEECSGTYLDRAEFESLRLKGVIIFPARLHQRAKKAEYLFGIPRLSEKLKGEPSFVDSWRLDSIKERIRSRLEFVVAYLGVNRNEGAHEELAKRISEIVFLGTEQLSVTWHFNGRYLSSQETEWFVYESEGIWTMIVAGAPVLDIVDPLWERVAGTILMACGLAVIERSSNLRDILVYPSDSLKEKLVSLGVAPESIEDARQAMSEAEVTPVATIPGSGQGTQGISQSQVFIPHSAQPFFPDIGESISNRDPSSDGSRPDRLPAGVSSDRPYHPARPHPETGLPAQQGLCSQIIERFGPLGWTVRSEVPDEETGARTDIVLEHPEFETYFIEVKNLNARQIFWSKLQIEQAEAKGDRYLIALLVRGGSEVRWSFRPLDELRSLPRKVEWTWRTHTSPGSFDERWRPIDPAPTAEAASYKAVVTIEEGFLESLPEGFSPLEKRLLQI